MNKLKAIKNILLGRPVVYRVHFEKPPKGQYVSMVDMQQGMVIECIVGGEKASYDGKREN